MRAWVRMSVAFVAFTCVVGCVGPGGAIGLSKPRLALYRCLLYEKRCIQTARAKPQDEFLFGSWGVIWLEKEGLFGGGIDIDPTGTEQLEFVGSPMQARWREVMLTRAEAARFFELLLDGHTLEAMAKQINFPDMDYLSWLRYDQMWCFLDWAANRRVLGQEVLRTLVDAAEAHRGKPGWEEWRRDLSELATRLVDELRNVPVEGWPEWYRQNGKRLYWNAVTEKYRLQLELR